MKKTYSSPELEKILMSAQDILSASSGTPEQEVFIDANDLF